MTTKPNPWIDRFDITISDAEICALTRKDAVPLPHLAKQPVEVAVRQLQEGLNAIFVPTKQIRHGIRLLLGAARAHAVGRYPSALAFIEGLHKDDADPAVLWLPICLTGLAGVGKTELLFAFARCLPADSIIEIPHHARVPLVSHCLMSVSAGISMSRLLGPLMYQGASDLNYRPRAVCENAPGELFRRGICLLLLDELQFLSQSQANAAAAKLLMQASKLGPPLIYVANYSLLHRLRRRPQEERQRLLSSFYVLEPDPVRSEDRIAVLKEKLRIAPEFRDLDLSRDGDEISRYTFSIKRLDTQLLSIAYRASRSDGSKVVKRKHIDQAYTSIDYAASRADVELLIDQEQGIPLKEGRCLRQDLICPFGAVKLSDVATHPAVQEYEQRMREATLASTLSRETQQALQKARQSESSNRRGKNVVKFQRPPATFEALLKGQKEFKPK